MIRLISVYKEPEAAKVLYELLLERDPATNISHKRMPSWREHQKFVESKPYRYWYLISAIWTVPMTYMPLTTLNHARVGACYLTRRNEIGIQIFRQYQGQGYGLEAVNQLIQKHKPLKEIPGVRSGRFIANINPANERSIRMFGRLGFTHLSNTYQL